MDARTKFLIKSLDNKWKAIQNDLERSQAVTTFFFSRVLSLRTNPLECTYEVTDGSSDGGLDGYFVDKPNKTLYLVQTKWYGPSKRKISNNESLELYNFFRTRLIPDNKEGSLSNEVKIFITRFHRMYVDYEIVLVYLTNAQFDTAAQKSYRRKKLKLKVYGTKEIAAIYRSMLSEDVKIETEGLVTLAVPEYIEINTDYKLETEDRIATIKVLQCAIRGVDLRRCYEDWELALFSRNLRFGLSTAINAGIKETAESERRASFYVLHNGISIICSDYRIVDISTKTKLQKAIKKLPERHGPYLETAYNKGVKKCVWLEKFQIINGAQTTISLSNLNDDLLGDISIPCKISKTMEDEISSQVAICNNTQNRIVPWDLVANSEELTMLQNYACLAIEPPIFMERRRGEKWGSLIYSSGAAPKRIRRTTAQKVYQAFLSLSGSPGQAYTRKGTVLAPEDPSRKAYHEISSYPDLELIIAAGQLANLEQASSRKKDPDFAKYWNMWVIGAVGHLYFNNLSRNEQDEFKKRVLSEKGLKYWKGLRPDFIDAFIDFFKIGFSGQDVQRILRNVEDEWTKIKLPSVKSKDIWPYINKQFRDSSYSQMRRNQGSDVSIEFYEINFAILAKFLDDYVTSLPINLI